MTDVETGPAFTAEMKSRVPRKESSVAILPGTKFASKWKHLPSCQGCKQEPVTNSLRHRLKKRKEPATGTYQGVQGGEVTAICCSN